MILNSPTISGSLTVTGNIITSGSITISGSIASASYATNAELLDGLDSTAFATTGAYSATSASLYATSASLSVTSGSLSATSGSLSATSGSLSATSGSLSTASGSFNTRVTALEVTGSALSSSLLTVSGSGYATSASLSTASGSFDSRVATIESKYATTGSNTFTSTQVVSGSILQSGSFTTTGTIIAQTINVQTVTSSVVYSSGSNVFGNSIGNSQTFTGSVLITGSLTIAGASSATSYSGTTIYGSTVACSPIGCFATSCATSFIGGTMSGTTIYGSTAVCSANGLLIGNGGVTATCNYLPKFTGASTIGNSVIQEASSNIGIGISPTNKLDVYGTSGTIAQIKDGSTYAGIVIDAHSSSTPFSRYSSSGTGKFELGYYNSKFYFNNNVGVNDTNAAMLITSTGNLGLGVTPSAWGSGSTAFQIGNGAIWKSGSRSVDWIANGYYDGTNYIYNLTNAATFYRQYDGQHQWYQAPSGTAGCAITFTQAMTLTAAGLLGLGTATSPAAELQIGKSSDVTLALSNSSSVTSGTRGNIVWYNSNNSSVAGIKATAITDNVGTELQFYTRPVAGSLTQTMTLNASGNLGLGTPSPDGSDWNGSSTLLHICQNSTNGALLKLQSSNTSGILAVGNNQMQFGTVTDDPLILYTNSVARHTIGSTGATTLNGCPLGHLLYIQNSNSGYYSSTDYLDNAGTEKLIVGYANASTGNALASKAIIYGVSGVGLNFYTNGCTTAKMVIDTTGNVGIGTCSPSEKLHLYNSTAATTLSLVIENSINNYNSQINFKSIYGGSTARSYLIGSNISIADGSWEVYDATVAAARLVITNDGTMLVGGASSSGAYNLSLGNATANTYYQVRSTNTNSLYGSDTRGTWMGNLSGKEAYMNASTFVPGVDNSTSLGTSSYRWSVVYAVNGSIQTSDERQKTNISTSDLGLDFINKLNPVSYKWKVGGNDVEYSSVEDENIKLTPTSVATPKAGVRTHYGLIAQQVKEILGDKDFGGYVYDTETDTMSLRYDQFISPLVKAIQELKAENDIFKTCLGIS